VQQALVVSMVTGAYIPPVRLDLLKNLDMPHVNAEFGCSDKDCLEVNCKGNRVELVDREPVEEDMLLYHDHLTARTAKGVSAELLPLRRG
jgi:hypothetical protein